MARLFPSRHHCDGQLLAIGVRMSSSSVVRLAFVVGFGGVLLVDQPGAVQVQRERALDVGLLREQHPADVGVLDDRDLRRRRILRGHRTALRPLRAYSSDLRYPV